MEETPEDRWQEPITLTLSREDWDRVRQALRHESSRHAAEQHWDMCKVFSDVEKRFVNARYPDKTTAT